MKEVPENFLRIYDFLFTAKQNFLEKFETFYELNIRSNQKEYNNRNQNKALILKNN